MIIENGLEDYDPSLADTDKIKIPTPAEIELRAHNAALELALTQDEIEQIGLEIERSMSTYSFSEEGRIFLKEIASNTEFFSHTFSYTEASELFYKIASSCDEAIPFNRPGDVMREPHKDSKFKLNINPQDLIDATVIACFSKQPDIMASFESWAILKPTKENPFAFSKLFVPVEPLKS